MDRQTAGRRYLEHLTREDLRVLAAAGGMDIDRAEDLRGRPELIVDLVDRPELFERLYGRDAARLVSVSPFFAFVVAIVQAGRELEQARFVAERSAPRLQVPVFDAPQLHEFLSDPMRRLFLAELLASFVRVASGRYWTHTARGWRVQRYSELDPVRLAQFVERSPRPYRPGMYRRLGDVSLFLTGIFPDYAQTYAFGPFDAARLLRAAGLPEDEQRSLAAAPPIQLLEHLGQRWYRRASESAPVATAQLVLVSQVAERFRDARRILNHIADRHFARVGNPWFGPPSV